MRRFASRAWFIALVKLGVSVAVTYSAFFAISDDDYSRLVIAQSFAKTPSLDPSGTSWLPLPFIAYGSIFAVFGKSLFVAKVVGWLVGLLSAVGLYCAARIQQLSKETAFVAGLLGAVFPHAAFYGAATVPDYPTAVLALLGATSLASREGRIRVLGALAASAATLCRYETWPLAAVVCGFALVDMRGASAKLPLVSAALLAPAGALSWLVHGKLHHSDAFFFVKRVTAYKRALAQTDVSFVEQLCAQPLSLWRGEPELVVVSVSLLLAVAIVLGKSGFSGVTWKRPALALFSVLVFLVIGALRDGAPTHHGERVLLSLWCGLTLVCAELSARLFAQLRKRFSVARSASLLGLPLGLLVAITAGFLRPKVVPVEPFVDRARELEMGQRLARALPPNEIVAVYTEDYGYFAIEAALGRPGALKPLHKRDPRHPELDPLSDSGLLATRLSTLGARYFVVPALHRPKASALAREIEATTAFALYQRD